MFSAVDGKLEAREPDLGAGPPPLVICVVEPGLNILGLASPKLSLPSLPAGVGRARGRRVCGMSVGPRAICHVRLALFHNIEG